ncbi:MAG: hypothetical protein LUB59_04515 [Candidatus Gastranaerophilales bacterium]|nr:hypothetical protein [Candidatus Gastranaerophilales bacterium]
MTMTQAITKWGIKAAGAAGAGMLLYDAHKEGKRISTIYKNRKNSEAALDWFDNTRNLHQPSHVNMTLKDKLFNWEITNNLRGFINGGIGYVKGFAGMMFSDAVPWGLSAAALLTKGPSVTSKGTAAKVSGAALGAYALYAFVKNVCGFGVSQNP